MLIINVSFESWTLRYVKDIWYTGLFMINYETDLSKVLCLSPFPDVCHQSLPLGAAPFWRAPSGELEESALWEI